MNELATYLAAFVCPTLAMRLPTKAASLMARYAASLSQGDPHPLEPGRAVASNVFCFPTPHPQRLKKEGCVWGLETLSLKQFWKVPGGGGLEEKKSDFDLVGGEGSGGEDGRGGEWEKKREEEKEEDSKRREAEEAELTLREWAVLRRGINSGEEARGLQCRRSVASLQWVRA